MPPDAVWQITLACAAPLIVAGGFMVIIDRTEQRGLPVWGGLTVQGVLMAGISLGGLILAAVGLLIAAVLHVKIA